MRDELSDRQAAIRRYQAGESIGAICQSLQRSEPWFHKWWQRYLQQGPEGLYDITRANQQVVNRTPPHIERAVISIRRRLAARTTVETRYNFVGAATIRAELEFEMLSSPILLTTGDILILDITGPIGLPDGIPDHARIIVGQGYTSTDQADYTDGCGNNLQIPPSTYTLLIDQHCTDRRHVAFDYNLPPGFNWWPIHVKG
jgi:hypothetical protein